MVRNSANTNPHRRAEKVQIGAAPYRGAPIRTCPTPAADTDLLGVEVKAQAGRLRPEQALFLERIRCAGGVAFVARDLRDVREQLNN